MSADNEPKASAYWANHPSTRASITPSKHLGMDLPPIRLSNTQRSAQSPEMQSVATRTSIPSLDAYQGWGEQRSLSLLSRPRSQTERIELPSIRQAVPEIQMRAGRDAHYRTDVTRHSPTPSRGASAPAFELDSLLSHKRRRLSQDDGENEQRDSFQRRSRSPSRFGQRMYSTTASPTSSARRPSIQSTSESRSGSSRPSPRMLSRGLPGIHSSPTDHLSLQRQEWRPTLPGLPSLTLDRGPLAAIRGHGFADKHMDTIRTGPHTYPQASNAYESPSSYPTPALPNGYHPRGQSFSGLPGRERTPFSSTGHHYSSGATFSYGVEMADSGNESKQRKRRGNLPKETTDKLRTWFHAHIQHPYPTEDEKQELMRQTGLQMNQISNWFINARRRQLPAMISNARAESDARTARGSEASSTLEGSTEYRIHCETRSSGTLNDSDDGGSSYDDEYSEGHRRKQITPVKKRDSF